jgi:inorganic pyrophosphatase
MSDQISQSLILAKQFFGKEVEVFVDRQLGTKHPKHDYFYEVNYGYLPGVMAPDGEELDAYCLGLSQPQEKIIGIVGAIVHRFEDDDDKLIVFPKNINFTDEEIEKAINFQEKWFKHEILRF